MATSPGNTLIQHLRRALLVRDGAGITDGELLERFITGGDEAAVEVGTQVRIWADKDNPQAAARIAAGPSADAAAPAAVGKVIDYQAGKSITLEVRQRGGQARK